MKKTFLLTFVMLCTMMLHAASYGIMINSTDYHAGTLNPNPLDPSFTEYQVLSVQVAQGATLQLWDADNNAGWAVNLDGASVAGIVKSGDHYVCNNAGCYDFYIKLKYNADQLYIGKGTGCSGSSGGGSEGGGSEGGGTTSNCQDGPYGILVNDTALFAAEPTGENDTQGRVQYLAKIQLAQGDQFVLLNRSCDAKWVEDFEPYGAYANFSGGKTAGKITCNVAGCYHIYVKMMYNDNILYIGEGDDCGGTQPVDPGETIEERPSYDKSVPERCPDVMLQAFYYDSYGDDAPGNVTISGTTKLGDTKWSTLLKHSGEIGMYFDMVWLPPSGKSEGGTGYHQTQYSNQNSAWGSKVELVEFIDRMHAANTKVIADIVINHAGCKSSWCDFYTQYFSPYGTFTPEASWICRTDEVNFQTEDMNCNGAATGIDDGGYNAQDNYSSARDWAHADTRVQAMMKAYLRWMKNEIGFDGWRYDYAQGFKGRYIDMYNSASANYFSVCEFWNGEAGAVKSYLNDCGWNTTVFDFSCKYTAIQGIADGDYNKCKNAGLSGTGDGRYAVTFVDSHDTYFGCQGGRDNQDEIGGCGNSMADYNKDRVLAANAYILSRPGVPCVFWPHWVKYQSAISKMVMARQITGVHSESVISDESAGNGYYKATITGTKGSIRLLLGPNSGFATAPSGYSLAYKGSNFAMYYQTTTPETPRLMMTPSQKFTTATFTVTLKADALSGTPVIYYTTDGTEPTAASTAYTAPFTVSATTTVKAIAVLNGQSSAVMEATYTYKEPQTTPIVVRFAHDDTWTGDVYIHTWGDGTSTGGWPGQKMSLGTDGWYTYQFPAAATAPNFVINNKGKGIQTGDLTTDCDVCYLWKNGCEELDEACGRITVPFSVVLSPETSIFRDNVAGLDVTITAVGAPEGTTPTIYYTTNGTNPTTASTAATTNPVTLNFKATTEVRAMAVAGNQTTEIVTAVYTYKAPQAEPITVTFKEPSWKKVNLYAWTADGAQTPVMGAWPGKTLTQVNAAGAYYYTFDPQYKTMYIIWNNGSVQSSDILVDENTCFGWDATAKDAVAVDCAAQAIDEVETAAPQLDFNAPMYNILGQQVNASYRGVVIQNGHKYLLQ